MLYCLVTVPASIRSAAPQSNHLCIWILYCVFIFVYLHLCICSVTFPTLTRPAAPESNHLPNVSTRTNCSALHVATSAAALAGTCSGRVLQMHSTAPVVGECGGSAPRAGERPVFSVLPSVARPTTSNGGSMGAVLTKTEKRADQRGRVAGCK